MEIGERLVLEVVEKGRAGEEAKPTQVPTTNNGCNTVAGCRSGCVAGCRPGCTKLTAGLVEEE